MGEKSKISIRNIRREANEELKKKLKDKIISEDENKNFEKNLPETELWALGRNNEKQCATKPSRNSVSFEDMNSLLLALPDTNFLHRSPTVCRALKSELRRRIVSIVLQFFLRTRSEEKRRT